MKLHKLLISSGLGLALALSHAVAAAPADHEGNNWMQSYYLKPAPDRLVDVVFAMSRSGALTQVGQATVNIGFLATVFARNPDRVEGWMHEFSRLPLPDRRLVAAAHWYSGLPHGDRLLREMAQGATPENEAEITQLLKQTPVAIANTPVLSEASLNLQWGAFLASGEPRHIVNALTALGSGEAGLSSAVRSSLAQKAASHQRVYEICQAQLASQPAGVRDQMRTALATARPQ